MKITINNIIQPPEKSGQEKLYDLAKAWNDIEWQLDDPEIRRYALKIREEIKRVRKYYGLPWLQLNLKDYGF